MQEDADRKSLLADLALGHEREKATRYILDVISRSREDEGPVFDEILANAERLCHASGSGLQLVDDARTNLTVVRNSSRCTTVLLASSVKLPK